jgi:hypothetical protein
MNPSVSRIDVPPTWRPCESDVLLAGGGPIGGHRFQHRCRMTDRSMHFPRSGLKTGSTLIMLGRHPRPDVRGTIAKDDTSPSFILSQKADGVTIGENQVRKIQDKDTSGRLSIDYLAQLAHIVRIKSTADREHNLSPAGAMNFQHRPHRSERNG